MRFSLRKRLVIFKAPPYKRRLVFSLITVGGFLLLSFASFWLIDCRIRPSLRELARVRARQIAIESIHKTIQSQIVPELEYGELVEMRLTDNGKVAYLQSKTGAINRISTKTILAVQQCLKELHSETVKIPLGQIFGLKTLASYGPLLTVKIIPVGVVEGSIKDQFDSVGINQIRHKIYIRIKTTIKMVVPLVREEIVINTDAPLTETVIMGEVPNLYLGTGEMILPKTGD
ncbi:MAG: sporulation protein YunB [Firmicutes bacterium]|nr:sporulation protein YunB [Bacillota bacterium]